ncbi:MAG: ankyrin repeat domain-containing protein, partial [Thermoanaerobaculia bacterium]
MPRPIHALTLLLLASPAFADSTRDLLLAARSGDLVEVRRLVEGGSSVNSSDGWGTTPLALAARHGQVEVAGYLLDNGADPSAREAFFGASVLDFALWKGAPAFRVAKMVLTAGAEDRATALAQALETGDVELARVAAASGPVLESEAAELRVAHSELEGELAKILASVETRPDPPPPSYSAEELAGFSGHFEAGDDQRSADIAVRDGGLTLDLAGERRELLAAAERRFRDAAGEIEVRYYGRAGTVEGILVE